ncbi:hypothetical protein OSTOST_23953, partial [Ostertagia ostertagi]
MQQILTLFSRKSTTLKVSAHAGNVSTHDTKQYPATDQTALIVAAITILSYAYVNRRQQEQPNRFKPPANASSERPTYINSIDSDQSFISLPLAEHPQLIYTIAHYDFETTIIVNTFGGHAERKHVTCVETLLVDSQEQSIKTYKQKIKPSWKTNFSNNQRDNGSKTNSRMISGTTTTERHRTSTLLRPHYPHIYHPQCSYEHSDLDYSDLWKLPGVGIDELQTNEELNRQIIANFYSTVQNRNGKIYIQFPWKTNKHQLADNYNLALSRLHQLYKMKVKNPK